MGDSPSSAKASGSTTAAFARRFFADDNSSSRPHASAASKSLPTSDGPASGARRRESDLSDYSLKDVRRSFQDSTDDILLPKPSKSGLESSSNSSHWHSAPLAFALLPAVGGMFFANGSAIITDVTLLGLAAIFLNWCLRLPWNWYESAQSIRKMEEYNEETMVMDESDEENALDDIPEDESTKPTLKAIRKLPAHEAAASALYRHEVLALLSCFLFPVLGAYLLHTIRSQLTRPAEGLVSSYNLTIFILASELRPMAHLVKLIQARTLHLQRIVASNPYNNSDENGSGDLSGLMRRLEDLEARGSPSETTMQEPSLNGKQSAILATEVRKGVQPDLDALTRAVRRYEKRATLQAFQTESRLQDLETRLNDAISLAAAAANSGAHSRGFTGVLVEWAATTVVLPIQAFGALVTLPFKTMMATINYSKSFISPTRPLKRNRKSAVGKPASAARLAGMPNRAAQR